MSPHAPLKCQSNASKIRRILRKEESQPHRVAYECRTYRGRDPIADFVRVQGLRVSWRTRSDSDFHTLLNAARRLRTLFEPEKKEWLFPTPEKLRAFVADPEVRRVFRRTVVIRDIETARFAVWRSEDGAMALAQPRTPGCATAFIPKIWWPATTRHRSAMLDSVVAATDRSPFVGDTLVQTEPWLLGPAKPVCAVSGEGVVAIHLDPAADPRHLLVAALIGSDRCGSEPIVLPRDRWGSIERMLSSAGIPIEEGVVARPAPIAQDFTAVPGWAAPAADGRMLRPHQKAAVAYFGQAGTGALLADEMGLGKTASAIAFAESVHRRRIIIVAPLVAASHWRSEIEAWGTGGKIFDVRSGDLENLPDEVRWCIVNYEQLVLRKVSGKGSRPERLSQSCRAISAWAPDLLVIDEAHRAKNPDSGRSQGVAEIAAHSERVLLLTGTPVRNHPREVLSLLALLSRVALDELAQMAEKWGTLDAASLIALAKARLALCMLRRTKREVLCELPTIDSRCVPVAWDDSEETTGLLAAAKEHLRAMASVEVENDPAQRHAHLAKAVHLIGLAKAASPTVLQFVLERHLRGQPTLVFGRHVDVAIKFSRLLECHGLKTAVLTGETPSAERTAIVEAFREGRLDVFVGTIGAAGESLSLTRANAAAMLELTWVPAELEQAGARGHRIGQQASEYSVVYFHADIPTDQVLLQCIRRKLRYTGEILGDEAYLKFGDVVDAVVRCIRGLDSGAPLVDTLCENAGPSDPPPQR